MNADRVERMSKRDLYFSKPMMNAAGMLGYAPNYRDSLPWMDFGVFVTNPISLHPRLPAIKPELISYPGGLLLHTGLANPGFKSVLKKYAPVWARSDLPVMVHLMADRPEETVAMVRALEGLENVSAVELGFAPQLADDIIVLAVEMCLGELPLAINLPAEQILSLGPRVLSAGAAAVSLAASRGALPGDDGRLVTGRLYGPALFPKSLEVVHSAAKLGLPLIAAGGLSIENSSAMLTEGALAFQLDTALWSNTIE
jgi:dihydroorotate dehydrogenase (NAD+) catalytic subunit